MKTNGRINIMEPNTANRFSLYDKIPVGKSSGYREALTGNWQNTQLSTIYFSGTNITNIQNKIRQGVYTKSNGLFQIGPQDSDTLKIIMRSIYLQYAKNKPNEIKEQVKTLNQLVLNYCIPQVIGEAEAYIKFRSDVSHLPTPLDLPTYISTAGNNELNMKPWF